MKAKGLILTLIALATLIGYSVISQTEGNNTSDEQHSLIAFVSNRDGAYEIYLMSLDGSFQHRLTDNGHAVLAPPSWSPDGGKIAFTSDREGNDDIYVINIDGSELTNLTNSSWRDSSPAWSPDGSKIAFASDRSGTLDIFVMNADGSGPVNLTNSPMPDGSPSWSPDGSRIAFTRSFTENSEIYVMNADGSDPVNLSNNLGDDYYPVWSPDGKQIAFTSERNASNGDIYVMDIDGENQINLTAYSRSRESSQSWSPDGLRIAFGSQRGTPQVYIINADGTNEIRLTQNDFPIVDYVPAWSPWLDDTIMNLFDISPTTIVCVGAPPTRLQTDMTASVIVPSEGQIRRNLRVRDEPNGKQVGSLVPGQQFTIIGGPICKDGLLWWSIETLDGTLSGWSVEGFAPDDYLMVPQGSD